MEIDRVSEAKKPSAQFKHDVQDRAASSTSGHIYSSLKLQDQIGNQAVQRLLRSANIQAKLTVGAPSDKHEQEADQVAEHVMNMPEPQKPSETSNSGKAGKGQVQHNSPKCKPGLKQQTGKEETIRRKSLDSQSLPMAPRLQSRINAMRGGGHALPNSTRAFFEPRFGHDFQQVRVHTNGDANRVSRAINARAFTMGDDIFFSAGRYQPETTSGRTLLAHEMTHVIQQSNNQSTPSIQRFVDDITRMSITPSYAEALSNERLLESTRLVTSQLHSLSQDTPEYDVARTNLSILQDVVASRGVVPGSTVTTEITQGAVSQPNVDLDKRIARFKRMVLITAIHRLANNRSNLEIWATVVGKIMSPVEVEAQALATEAKYLYSLGNPWIYEKWARETNPKLRFVYERQMHGHYLACTGCHYTRYAQDWAARQFFKTGPAWMSPADRLTEAANWVRPADRPYVLPWAEKQLSRESPAPTVPPAGVGGAAGARCEQCHTTTPISPTAGSTPAMMAPGVQAGAFSSTPSQTARILEAIERIKPIMQQLGPNGYKVLPQSLFSMVKPPTALQLRNAILVNIRKRQNDYLQLIAKINRGEIGYEHFAPILNALLPTADFDVQMVIKDEMDSKAFWDLVESIVVGIVSIALLILIIFPPTSALGIACLAALEIGLGGYLIAKAPGMISTGEAYSLGTGAHDVFTKEQQEAGAMMQFSGFMNLFAGPLLIFSGAVRASSVATSLATTETALTTRLLGPGSQTIRRGGFLVTINADGSAVATVMGRPDLLIVVRGGQATMYQVQTLAGGAGTRLIPLISEPVAGGAASLGTTGRLVPATSTALTKTRPMLPAPGGGGAYRPTPVFGPAAAATGRSSQVKPPLQLGPGKPVVELGGVKVGETISAPYTAVPKSGAQPALARAKVVDINDDFVVLRHINTRTSRAEPVRHHVNRRTFQKWVNDKLVTRWTSVREYWMKNRPPHSKSMIEKVWNRHKKGGVVRDPYTKEVLTWDRSQSRQFQWHMGHAKGEEYHKLVDDLVSGRITEKQFLKEYHNPDNYITQHWRENISGVHEAK